MATDKPRRLGRGLEALISQAPAGSAATAPRSGTSAAPGSGVPATAAAEESALREIALARILPNPFQPRREFDAADLADLEASLKAGGLLQPVTVRPSPTGSGFELIAGERRLRAATALGWTTIPAVVKEIDDRGLLTLALVENLQRADLNPLEEAEGYRRLIDEFSLTQQQVADAVGKDRVTISNLLRTLQLPQAVQEMLRRGQLTLGHARPLLALKDEKRISELAKVAVADQLSVREVERRVSEAVPERRRPRGEDSHTARHGDSAEARRIEDGLRRHLQTDVRISLSDVARGTIQISFYSAEDLERILEIILGQRSGS